MIKSLSSISKFLIALVVFGLFLFVAPTLEGEQGYIVISFGGYLIEGSLVEFTVTLLVTALIAYVVLLLVRYSVKMCLAPTGWWRKRGDTVNANFFQNGLDLLALGQWQQAADQFLKVKRTEKIETAQQLAMFSAVKANDAELTSDIQQKLQLPVLANNSDKTGKPVFNAAEATFTQLILLVQQKAYEQASEIIEKKADNPLKLSLPLQLVWLEVRLALQHWQIVDKYLPKLVKQAEKQQSESAFAEFQQQVEALLTDALQALLDKQSVNQLQQVWRDFHKATKTLPSMSSAYLAVLSSTKQPNLIETHLFDVMSKNSNQWLLEQVRNYFKLAGQVHMDKLFTKVQKMLMQEKDNKVLITTLAYLAAGQKDFQLSKQALEQVIYSNQNSTDFKLYATVLADLGEMHASVEVFKSL